MHRRVGVSVGGVVEVAFADGWVHRSILVRRDLATDAAGRGEPAAEHAPAAAGDFWMSVAGAELPEGALGC